MAEAWEQKRYFQEVGSTSRKYFRDAWPFSLLAGSYPCTRSPTPYTLHPKLDTRYPKPQTPNPKPETRKRKPPRQSAHSAPPRETFVINTVTAKRS